MCSPGPCVRHRSRGLGAALAGAGRLAGHLRVVRRVRELAEVAIATIAFEELQQRLDVVRALARSKSSGSTSANCSQVTGIDTVARGVPRIDHAEAIVRSRAAWL